MDRSGLRRGVEVIRNLTWLCLLLTTAAMAAPASAPLTADDLVRLERVTDPQVAPDGRSVAFVIRETDMEANRGRTDIWLLDLTQKNATPRRLTQNDANDSSPRWAPDSRAIYFLSTRSGQSQVWRLPLTGGEASRVTDYPLDVGSPTIRSTSVH